MNRIDVTEGAYWPRKTHMMIPHPVADDLRDLMAEHSLTNRDIATIACVHLHTVESWLADRHAASFRLMPPRQLNAIRAMLPGFMATRDSKKRKA